MATNVRQMYQFLFSNNPMLTMIECNCVIDSGQTGQTRSLKGSGVVSLTRVATGTYKLVLEQPYKRQLVGVTGFVSATTGNTAITALTPGTVYIIRTLGTSTQANWVTAGVPSDITAAPGVSFIAAATSSGTGSVLTPTPSGIVCTEGTGDSNLTIGSNVSPYLIFQTLGHTSSSVTTLIPTDPVDGSVMAVHMFFRNSSLKGAGE